jgi:hypothetical protein
MDWTGSEYTVILDRGIGLSVQDVVLSHSDVVMT